MRTIIRGVVNGKKIPLTDIMGLEGKKIKRVYTILDEEKLFTKYDPETGEPYKVDIDNATLLHRKTVFMEDTLHDWTIWGDSFKLHAHSSDVGDVVDILIEYE